MRHPLFKALATQAGATLLAFGVAGNGFLGASPAWWQVVLVQGLLAAIISRLLCAPGWWSYIHLGFAPAVWAAHRLALPPAWYGIGFTALALIYWSSFRTRVPLFLSNRITVHRLAAWLPDARSWRVMDLGSGTGSFVRRLARLRPDWQIVGAETAPAPWLLSRWLARRQPNAQLVRADFWQLDLADYDLVYAFLSPVPMSALWQKAVGEMKAGALLVSNSFPVPGQTPEAVIEVDDRRATCLYCYRMPGARKRR